MEVTLLWVLLGVNWSVRIYNLAPNDSFLGMYRA